MVLLVEGCWLELEALEVEDLLEGCRLLDLMEDLMEDLLPLEDWRAAAAADWLEDWLLEDCLLLELEVAACWWCWKVVLAGWLGGWLEVAGWWCWCCWKWPLEVEEELVVLAGAGSGCLRWLLELLEMELLEVVLEVVLLEMLLLEMEVMH